MNVGDLVVWTIDNQPHTVTKILPGKIQLDDKHWERDENKILPTAATSKT